MAEVQGRGLQTISPEALLADTGPEAAAAACVFATARGKGLPTPCDDGEQYGGRGPEYCHGSSIAVAFTFNGG
jgi:hypothetical protein